MGIWRGKKGSTVFYYNRNSNNGQKQAMRERVYEISNPKSVAQATQRMKLAPAARVANALNAIIKRSWQGVEYGGKGRNEFMKYALRMKSGFPFMEEGDNRAVPGEYQISKGGIIDVTMVAEDVDCIYSTTFLYGGGASQTIGTLSTSLIRAGLKEGDQVTIVVCTTDAIYSEDALNANYTWRYASFIIDTNDETDLTQWPIDNLADAVSFGSKQTDAGRYFALYSIEPTSLAGAAIIVSRLNGTTYERSNSKICVGTIMGAWFTPTQQGRARRSYEKQDAAASTNWPVEPDSEGGGSGGTAVDSTYTLSGLTGDKAGANGKIVRVRVNDVTGDLVAVYVTNADTGILGTRPLIVGTNNQPVTYTVSMQDTGLNPSEVPALASLRTISVD